MSFTQVIRFQTEDPSSVQQLLDQWLQDAGAERTATRVSMGKVREEDDAYVLIVDFPSADAAQVNSELEATNRWADEMRQLARDGLEFTDLDVVRNIEP